MAIKRRKKSAANKSRRGSTGVARGTKKTRKRGRR
jgi:hypothetical protein